MIRVAVLLTEAELKALRTMCRRFQYGDAQHLLRHYPNVRPDTLCEAISKLRTVLDGAGDSP